MDRQCGKEKGRDDSILNFQLPLILVLLVLESYVALRIPEAMLFNHIQLVRASELYHLVQKEKVDELYSGVYGYDKIVDYLKSIPEDMFETMDG